MVKSEKGFTFVEVCVCVVIASILAFTGAVVYRSNHKKAIISEGLQLVSQIKEEEDIRMSFNDTGDARNNFKAIDRTDCYTFVQDTFTIIATVIDARINKYFKSFEVLNENSPGESLSAGEYKIKAYYGAIATIVLKGYESKPYEIETYWNNY